MLIPNKLLSLLLLVIAISLSNCKKDEDTIVDLKSTSIQSYISDESDMSMFNDAIQRTSLASMLTEAGPMTIFAPNNQAFQAFLDNNNWKSIDDINASILETILKIHISTEDNYEISSMSSSQNITTIYQNRTIYINLEDPTNPQVKAGLTNAKIKQQDVVLKNGVIHKIDYVLSL